MYMFATIAAAAALHTVVFVFLVFFFVAAQCEYHLFGSPSSSISRIYIRDAMQSRQTTTKTTTTTVVVV